MKHTKRSAMTLLLAATLLLSGCAEKEPASALGTDMTTSTDSSNDNSSADPESSGNGSSESESANSSQNTVSSDSSPNSFDDPLFIGTQKYLDLKGEELIAKFEWPYDVPIDIEGMTAQKVTVTDSGDVFEDILLSEISNKFRWTVKCDYGCLAMTPDHGGEYEYKKYKAGDKIGDLAVSQIETFFKNVEFFSYDINYFAGINASFNGEITLTGEMMIKPDNYVSDPDVYFITGETGEIQFYPDAESRKKLPIVNFPMPDMPNNHGYYPTHDNLRIFLGNKTDYPGIDFTNIPTDGRRVKVKIKIKDYNYRAIVFTQLPFFGFADIVDGSLEIL